MCAVTWRGATNDGRIAKLPSKVPTYGTNLFPCNGYVWYICIPMDYSVHLPIKTTKCIYIYMYPNLYHGPYMGMNFVNSIVH